MEDYSVVNQFSEYFKPIRYILKIVILAAVFLFKISFSIELKSTGPLTMFIDGFNCKLILVSKLSIRPKTSLFQQNWISNRFGFLIFISFSCRIFQVQFICLYKTSKTVFN